MKKIQIAVTFWNRFPIRLECLKKAYSAIEEKMSFGKYEHEWIISCESDRCVEKEKVDKFLNSKSNIIYKWKKEKASLSSNLNNVLKMCSAPFIFYLQDDWLLTRTCNIEKDVDFLLSSNYDLIRYRFARRDENKLTLINKKLDLYEISHDIFGAFYSDQPHLKKLSFHKKYGYFPESLNKGFDSGNCETQYNRIIKKSNARILFKANTDGLFKHISGKNSTLKEKWENWHKVHDKK